MKFIKKYKVIWIQSIAFVIVGIFRHQTILIIVGYNLLLLPFLSQKLALKYIILLEKILHLIGFWIKNIMFTLLFFLIITPISFILKLQNQKKIKNYILRDPVDKQLNFEKMW